MLSKVAARLRTPFVLILMTCALGGGAAAAQAAHTSDDPAVVGHWEAPFTAPIVGIHAAVLHTGKVLLVQGLENSEQGGRAFLWDPTTGSFQEKAPPDNLFCSGHSILADGRAVFVGGHKKHNDVGIKDTNVFDPVSESWIERAPMAYARWYPTSTTLADGKVLATSGNSSPTRRADVPELFDPVQNSWQQLTGAKRRLPLYPWIFGLPSGKVFNAGPNGDTKTLNLSTQSWGPAMNTTAGDRGGFVAPAVSYAPGKFLISGGKDPATRSAETIDLSASDNAEWQAVDPMNSPRRHHNATVLPDGKVLVTGGTKQGNSTSATDRVLAAEMYDPAARAWSPMASMQKARVYHSTASLLPDGRVVVTGTDNELDFEIYSPPYLFKGPRPDITSAPSTIAYGGLSDVTLDVDAATIKSVALVRPGSVTHSFNMGQAHVPLTVSSRSGNTLSVEAPANAKLAAPGHYMLFVVDNEGRPSVAKWVKLQ